MVIKDENLIFIVFLVIAPSLKSLNNGQNFLIISLIINLSNDHFLRENRHKMLLANFRLEKNCIFLGYIITRILIQSHLI